MPPTILSQCPGQMLVQPRHSLAYDSGDVLSAVFGAAGVVFLELGDGLEFAEGFGLDGFGFVFGVEDGFEFLFFPVEGAQGFGVVEGETWSVKSL